MSGIDSATLARRHEHLRQTLSEEKLDGIAVNPGPSLNYLTGLHFHISERPVIFFFPVKGTPSLVLPELESQKVHDAAFELVPFTYTEALDTWAGAFEKALISAGLEASKVGIEPRSLRVLELRFLEGASSAAQFPVVEQAVAKLRMQKDDEELELMRKATVIAEKALLDTLPFVCAGVSERTISATLIQHLLKHGSEGELPFQPIIAFGPNSANPHAVPSDYEAKEGDLVLFDWGANYMGYFSDLTRMFALGEPESELRKIVEIVEQSNAAGRAVVSPGIRAGAVDDATRGLITGAGYGEYFSHRTGHGLGLEVHEEPYIRADNDRILEEGMTFTIEPGIYLSGRGGARVEDDMVVTSDGGESLSTISRELRILSP